MNEPVYKDNRVLSSLEDEDASAFLFTQIPAMKRH